MEQRTNEWYQARLGKVTASKLSDVMSKGATRDNYMADLLTQRLTEEIEDSFITTPMQRGIDLESEARDLYLLKSFDSVIEEVGSVPHPTISNFSASPDGLVNDDGLIEIKCPNKATHIKFLKTGKPKREYILQMHGQMLCTERKWCDFISYDNRFPDNLSYKCVRIEFNESLANEIESEVIRFLIELDELESEFETINQ